MIIPAEYAEYFTLVKAGENIELKDAQTKLIMKSENDCYRIIVDRGIVQNIESKIKKSDFAILDEVDNNFLLVELKGSVVDEAYKQLLNTTKEIDKIKELNVLTKGRDKMIACIVSPNRQQIPRGNNTWERELAKSLLAKSGKKVKDMYDLIYYIKVVPRQSIPSINLKMRQVICSNKNPIKVQDFCKRV